MLGFITVDIQDRLAIVTVNRPEVRNALNSQVVEELAAAFDRLARDPQVGAVVLIGAGDKAFVAGADIKEMVGKTGLEMQAFSELGRRLCDAIEGCPKPVIAAINGYALGGGCEIAMACDIRLASETARIGQAEINIGTVPGFGGSQRLPRLVGGGWAAQMVLTGEPVDAATAERIGLVNRVVPADRLLDEAKALARKMIDKSPVALALAKGCLRAAQEMPLSQGLSYETAAFGIAGATQDKAEGMTAFLEKRKPVWKGA